MNTFKTPKGTELPFLLLRGKQYLQVQHRMIWFREEHPDWAIETNFLQLDEKHTIAQATIKDSSGRVLSMGTKHENKINFSDHTEKAESGAVGRALAFLGYGTAFAQELEEGDRLADSPVFYVPKSSGIARTDILPGVTVYEDTDPFKTKVNDKLLDQLKDVRTKANYTPDDVKSASTVITGKEDPTKLTETEMKFLLAHIKKNPKEKK